MSWSDWEVYTFGKFEINHNSCWFRSLIFKYINVNYLTVEIKKAKSDIIGKLKKQISWKILRFRNKNTRRKNISHTKR